MAHLQIPFISELDQHYSPRQSMESRRPSVEIRHNQSAMSSYSHFHLPLLSALDEHYSPRPSISDERRPSVVGAATQAPLPSRSHLSIPLISNLDTYYSPRASLDGHRPTAPEVSPKPVATTTTPVTKKQQASFMDNIQSFPWFSGSH